MPNGTLDIKPINKKRRINEKVSIGVSGFKFYDCWYRRGRRNKRGELCRKSHRNDENVGCVVCSEIAEFLNEQDCIDHKHQFDIEEKESPMGVGVDLIVWQLDQEKSPKNLIEQVSIQEKYDIANNENTVYAVATVNLFKLFKKEE